MNPRISPPKIMRLSSLMRMMLKVIQALWFLSRNTGLTTERLNNRIPIAIAAPINTVSSSRSQDIPSAGQILISVRSAINLIPPRPRGI